MTMITATASNPRSSTCLDIPGALDVDVEIRLEDGVLLQRGEVTLAPGAGGKLVAYGGQPDHWIGGALLRTLHTLSAPGSASELDFRAACDEIERAAIEAAR
jgi:hypothetical protein